MKQSSKRLLSLIISIDIVVWSLMFVITGALLPDSLIYASLTTAGINYLLPIVALEVGPIDRWIGDDL